MYYFSLFAICILVSIYSYIAVALLERVFRNYMPSEEDLIAQEDLGSFNLDAERQEIINRYMGRSSLSELDQGEVVRVDENNEVIQEEDYKVVKVDKDSE